MDTTTHGTSPATVDYDADNDGLIDVSTLAQLNAIRYDLDGNGQVASGDQTNYDTAFPNAEDNMGCNESVASISAGTGNPACSGYELTANLDFDTGTKGTRSDDTYYNSGQGWQPIGGTFTGTFDGNTYIISNLHINRSGATTVQYAGLFGKLGSAADVRNLRLKDVDVTVGTNAGASANPGAVYAGGIAGDSAGDIASSYVIGDVTAIQSDLTDTNLTEGAAYAGGLVGNNTGDISASYARGDVLAEQKSTTASLSTYAGGLVGYHNTGAITASYADVDAEAKTTATAASATLTAGGLAGHVAGGSVVASFSTGAPTTTGGTSPTSNTGGLIGNNSGTITNSYWDTTTSGITATGAGTGKTTSELQTPTTETGIYANWNVDIDGDNTNDDPWDFGTASQYPVLDYTGHTASQQRVTVTLTVSPTTIWERALNASDTPENTARVNQTTLTVTPGSAWHESIVITVPTNAAAYTLGASTFTFSAGSTTAQTTTMTAVNNLLCGASTCPSTAVNNAISLAITPGSPWVTIGTAPTVTINDDDETGQADGREAER